MTSLRRAETQRSKGRKREQARRSFFANPHRFTRKLFEQSKTGELNAPQEESEYHLRRTYSDPQRELSMADISLLNVEGKIMFGILTERISPFMLENGYISTEGRNTRVSRMSRAHQYDLAYHTRVKEVEERSECYQNLANA